MTNQHQHKRRAAVGVALAALGFVTAFLATASKVMPLGLLGALALFVAGLVLVETALFRALDDSFADAAVHESYGWAALHAAD